MILRCVFPASLVSFAAALSAQTADVSDFATGNGLHAACTSDNAADQSRCMAFVEGFVYGSEASWLEIGRRAELPNSRDRAALALYCAPEGVTLGQLKDVVSNGLADLPQARHLPSNVLVQLILIKAFPCSKKS